jgi:HEAT repeat protein
MIFVRTSFTLLIFLVCASVGASDFVSLKDINAELQKASDRLGKGGKQERLSAVRTIQNWSRYAESSIPALITALRDPEPEVRSAVALTLEAIGPPAKAAVPALAKALVDKGPGVPAAAAFALASIGIVPKEAVAGLRGMTRMENPRPSIAAAFALGVSGHKVVPTLERERLARRAAHLLYSSLHNQTAFESGRLATAIGHVAPDVALSMLPKLLSAVSNPNPTIASNAEWALRAMGKPLKVYEPEIIRSIEQGSGEAKLDAIRKAGWLGFGTANTVAVLRKSLQSGSAEVQREAAGALGRIGPQARSASPALARLVLSGSRSIRAEAAFAILKIDPDSITKLLPTLKRKDAELASEVELRWQLSRL